jgi:hypothetical protein
LSFGWGPVHQSLYTSLPANCVVLREAFLMQARMRPSRQATAGKSTFPAKSGF